MKLSFENTMLQVASNIHVAQSKLVTVNNLETKGPDCIQQHNNKSNRLNIEVLDRDKL